MGTKVTPQGVTAIDGTGHDIVHGPWTILAGFALVKSEKAG